MPLPALLADLVLPVIGTPLPIIAAPGLVIAQCRAGIVGALPALNAPSPLHLANWLDEITRELKAARLAGEPVAPYAITQVVHASNLRLDDDMEVCGRYGVPLIMTSVSGPAALVPVVHGWGGLVFHDAATLREAREAVAAGVDGLVLVCAGDQAGALSPFAFVELVRGFWEGPIVLSGSIGTGRGILAAQIIGADLAAVGSRFFATTEARTAEGFGGLLLDSGPVASSPQPSEPPSAAGGSGGAHPRQEGALRDEIAPTALVVAHLRSEYYAARSARLRLGGAPAAVVARPQPPLLAAGGARG